MVSRLKLGPAAVSGGPRCEGRSAHGNRGPVTIPIFPTLLYSPAERHMCSIFIFLARLDYIAFTFLDENKVIDYIIV